MIDIYKMQLHDIADIGGATIIRVAGGWVYTFAQLNGHAGGVVFVPYHNEFQRG